MAGSCLASEPKTRFVVVDDHPLFREALRFAVFAAYPDAYVRECSSLSEAVSSLEKEPAFDLALLDLKIPDATGFEGLVKLRTLYPRLPIVIVSGLEDHEIVKNALSCGAAGFIPKSTKKNILTAAIKSVMDGHLFLPDGYEISDPSKSGDENVTEIPDFVSFTPQQLKVIGMIRNGMLNKQIAFELGVSETTVKAHVSKIFKKLGVTNRTQAAMEIEKLVATQLFEAHDRFDN